MDFPRFSQQQIRSIQFGALGFGLGLSLAVAAPIAFRHQITSFSTSLAVGTALYALAGAIGGAMLGLAGGSRQPVWVLALAGGLGCGLGFLLTTYAITYFVYDRFSGGLVSTLAMTIQFGLVGASTGAWLGAAQRSWRPVAWLTVAGAVGFGLYYSTLEGLDRLRLSIDAVVPRVMGEPTHDLITLTLAFAFWGALGGIVVGACLGLAHALLYPGQSRQA